MIISKTPFRISLFGGSTDYESFYSQNTSLLIGFALDKYCYLLTRKTPKIFNHKSKIMYSSIETVNNNKDIQHNGVRGVLEFLNIKYGLEISHLSDLPSQTGIGSSSSFIVGLLNALYTLKHTDISKKELAEQAIYIERKLLAESGGVQDQIWAAYGGMNSIHINKNGSFEVKKLPISETLVKEFFNRSIMIHTGKTRRSYKIARSHDNKSALSHKKKIAEIAHVGYDKFTEGDIDGIGSLLNDSWIQKQKISSLISNSSVNKMYKELQEDGMIGGKLLGTGGQGFIFGILGSLVDINHIKSKYKSHYVGCGLSKSGSIIVNG
jgi:D-glycero-alpha-D-manno-heptose-7-phosphate kinase